MIIECIGCGHAAGLYWGTIKTEVSHLGHGNVMLCEHCGLAQVLSPFHRLATPEDMEAMPDIWRERMLERQTEIINAYTPTKEKQ